mmetsp:Transcript_86035/g.266424  ORF Transcript_86035/g.266424 Transcript_86035/m.266424 type:complete len:226 (+) Transcript_86035:384-1061(+)
MPTAARSARLLFAGAGSAACTWRTLQRIPVHQQRLSPGRRNHQVREVAEVLKHLLSVLEDLYVVAAELPQHRAGCGPLPGEQIVHGGGSGSRAPLKLVVGVLFGVQARPLLLQLEARPKPLAQGQDPLVALRLRCPGRLAGFKGTANLCALRTRLLHEVLHGLDVPPAALQAFSAGAEMGRELRHEIAPRIAGGAHLLEVPHEGRWCSLKARRSCQNRLLEGLHS